VHRFLLGVQGADDEQNRIEYGKAKIHAFELSPPYDGIYLGDISSKSKISSMITSL
jgi:hypothetical protein